MHIKISKGNILKAILFLVSFLVVLIFRRSNFNNLAVLIFFTTIFILVLINTKMFMKLKCIIFISYIVRITYSYYIYINRIIKFPDTIGYINTLKMMLKTESISYSNVVSIARTLHVGYNYINYFIFKIFNTEYSLYLFNIFLFFMTIILLYYHISSRFTFNVANMAVLILTLSMNLFIYTSHVLKDSLVLFLGAFSIYIYDRYKREGNFPFLLLLIIGLAFLTMTRIYSGVGIAAGILFDFLIYKKDTTDRRKFIFIIIALVLLLLFTPLKDYIDMSLRFMERIEVSIYSLIVFIKAIISFFFSPFFWNMTKEYSVYTPIVIDSTFLLIFSPLLVLFFYRFIKYKEYRYKTYIYLIPMLFHIIALSSAYGTGWSRQKIAVYPYIILFYILGVPRRNFSRLTLIKK